MQLAKIILFTYARPWHTRQTIDALKLNFLASESDLIIYSDASPAENVLDSVVELREYLKTISGFRSVEIRFREENFGLSRSIIEGVSEVLKMCDRIIVLEDDMVTSPYFLRFMNEALDKYSEDERIIGIHGYTYPVKERLPEAFFLLGADCWGWATWRRGWELFNADGKFLLDELRKKDLLDYYDFNGAYPYSKMLEGQTIGKNDSWAARWYASALLAGKLTLHSGRSLVHNIGFDNSGTHCGDTNIFDVHVSDRPVSLDNIVVTNSVDSRMRIENFLRKTYSISWAELVFQRLKSYCLHEKNN
ncbi:glycosyltransferase family 2 protein [Polynucleobacter paneuropaeus]|nr:glycosyltransferase family 2 protein [Polynucleobacter paneuropaeus]